jgi:beta-aspartyl-peptidase (threonine type)
LVLYIVALLLGGGVVLFAFFTANRDDGAPQAAIRRVLEEQDAAWNRGDLPGFMTGYWHSSELSFYSGKKKEQGWQETFDRYRKAYQSEGNEMGKLTFSELDIQLLGPKTALVRGRWQVVSGNTKEPTEGLFTLLMKRFPEGWRIVHDHTSRHCPDKKN